MPVESGQQVNKKNYTLKALRATTYFTFLLEYIVASSVQVGVLPAQAFSGG